MARAGIKMHLLLLLIWTASIAMPGMNATSQIPALDSLSANDKIRAGDSLLNNARAKDAYTYYSAAAQQYENAQNIAGLIRAKTGIAQVYFNYPDWSRAISTLIEADNLSATLQGNEDSLHIRILYLLAQSYNESGIDGNSNHLDSACLYYQKSLKLRQAERNTDNKSLADNYYKLGSLFYYDLMDYDKSEENMLKAWEIYKKNSDTLYVNYGRSNYILASLNRTKGDLGRAISYATEANRIFSNPGVNKPLSALYSQIVLANTYYDESRYEKAIKWYEIVIGKAIEYFGDNATFLINFYNNYAAALTATNQPTNARRQLKRAITINFNNPPVDYENLSFSYLHLADCAEQNHKPDSALYFLNQCLTIRKEHLAKNRRQIYQSIRFIGEFYERKDSLDLALQYYQDALQVLIPEFKSNDIVFNPKFITGNREDVFYILYDKARILIKRYYQNKKLDDLQNAYTLYITINRLIDEAQNSSFFEESKLLFYELFKKDLDAGILCAYESYIRTKDSKYLEAFFMLTEKNKYMLLLQSLMNTERKSTLGIPDSIKVIEKELNKKISFLKHQINSLTPDSTNATILAKWNHQLLISTNTRDQMQKNLAALYPDYYDLKYAGTLISLKDVQKHIKKNNQQVLEYYWGDTLSFALYIYPDTAFVKNIPIREGLLNALHFFTLALNRKTHQDDPLHDFKSYVSSAHSLYQTLVKPGLSIGNTNNTSRLIIIPDGPLAQLPFEAFLTAPVSSEFIDYSRLPYLIRTEYISYTYSLNLMIKSHPSKKCRPEHELLAMSYSGPTEITHDRERKGGLQELPWSEKELRSIGKIMQNGIYLSGIRATESQFKNLAPQSRIVHLAVHGIADQNNALNSRLEFKSIADKTNDGQLYNYELYDLNLRNTQLAVLSACETGLGKQYKGEGIFSIARAFYYAGCPAIVMSLWKVNDKYTANLMQRFYRNLAKKIPVDAALRDAKCSFLEEAGELEAHPANWASFILIGDPNSLNRQHYSYVYLLLAMAITGILALVYFKSRK